MIRYALRKWARGYREYRTELRAWRSSRPDIETYESLDSYERYLEWTEDTIEWQKAKPRLFYR